MHLHSHDPRPLVPKDTAFCMFLGFFPFGFTFERPCQLDGNELPCWNSGAWLGGSQVVACEMSCLHQKRVMQPEYSCTDFTGVDSQSSCFGRGDETHSKCMFVSYQARLPLHPFEPLLEPFGFLLDLLRTNMAQ